MKAVHLTEIIGSPELAGYTYGGTLYYTESGTFDKTDYPGLRAIFVRMVGGGGGGGGADTTAAAQTAVAPGGGSGAYAEALIMANDLADSEAVTVGAGGAGGVGASATGGGGGGDSILDTISGEVRAEGGDGGVHATSATGTRGFPGANPGTPAGSAGDFILQGEGGKNSRSNTGGIITEFGYGGSSAYGVGGQAANSNTGASGNAGTGYGAGGAGGFNYPSQGSTRNGGAGTDGVVIVELLY